VKIGHTKRFCSSSCRQRTHKQQQRKATEDRADPGREADPGPTLPAPSFATEKSAESQGSRAAQRRPAPLPDRVERPFAPQKRDDDASDPAALKPVTMPWENATAP
jgi:hypothetical protein